MVKITEYEGAYYSYPKNKYGNRWIKIEWSTGYIDMKKYYFDKLSKKKRALLLNQK